MVEQSRSFLAAAAVIYVVTGIFQPTIVDVIKYSGGTGAVKPPMMLPTCAMCGAMALTVFVPESWAKDKRSNKEQQSRPPIKITKGLLLAAAVDLVSSWLLYAGLLMTGSAVFVVIYGSNTMWTAVFAFYWSKKRLARMQWIGIATLSFGLLLNAAGNAQLGGADAHDGLVGSVIVLMGTALHSAYFLISEECIGTMPTYQFVSVSGAIEFGIMLCYEAVIISFYGLKYLLLDHVQQAGGSTVQIFACYALLVLSNTLHAAAFFLLLGHLGAVGSATMKGAQSVFVFVIGAVFFCDKQKLQCYTFAKAVSMAIVVVGLLLYGMGSSSNISGGGGSSGSASGSGSGSGASLAECLPGPSNVDSKHSSSKH
jgi:drug/metabolite transporter (DMT)-like permease